jgi:cullin 1
MGILLAFNTATGYAYEELRSITNLNADVLNGQLGILVKAKVVLMEGSEVGAPGSKYELNMDFKR